MKQKPFYNNLALCVTREDDGMKRVWKRAGMIVVKVRKREQVLLDDPMYVTYQLREGVFPNGER